MAGDWPKARQCFERAIHTAASQTHRADRLDKLGHVHWSTGAVAEARACYQEALMLRLAAVAQRTQTGQPIPIGLSRSVAIGEMNLGDVEFAAGAYKPAEALWESARQRWEATVLADPSDLRARWEYAVCLDRLGRVGLAIAKPDLTCRYGNEALSLVQQVRQCDPQDRLARRQEAVIRENLSQAHWRLGRGDMARALRTEVIGLRQSLAAEAPDDVTATFELYTAWRNLGVLELDDYRPAQASKALRAAAEHLQTLAQKQGDSQPRGWAEQLDDLRADLTLCGHAERACRDLEFALAQGEHTGWFVTVRVRAQTRADDYAAALETIGTMIERCRDANAVWDAVVLYASVAVDAHRRDPPAADKALSKLADAVGLLLFVQ